jgi:hypothetical protein
MQQMSADKRLQTRAKIQYISLSVLVFASCAAHTWFFPSAIDRAATCGSFSGVNPTPLWTGLAIALWLYPILLIAWSIRCGGPWRHPWPPAFAKPWHEGWDENRKERLRNAFRSSGNPRKRTWAWVQLVLLVLLLASFAWLLADHWNCHESRTEWSPVGLHNSAVIVVAGTYYDLRLRFACPGEDSHRP